ASPSVMRAEDAAIVDRAIDDAMANPVSRPIQRAKLARPQALPTDTGAITVPPRDDVLENDDTPSPGEESPADGTTHTQIQWLLLKLGSDMGMKVWAPMNDRNKNHDGHKA